MAVYTRVERGELENLVGALSLGELVSFEGVADGLENTTYFLRTRKFGGPVGASDEWVLTVLESADYTGIPFVVTLAAFLKTAGLPVPDFVADRHGCRQLSVAGKPALLAPRMAGQHLEQVLPKHCAEIGAFLGRMHRRGKAFAGRRENPYGLSWSRQVLVELSPVLPSADVELVRGQQGGQAALQALAGSVHALPAGAIHADLFRDNALFLGDKLSAVIDFQGACTDWLLLDVAIALNDWASRPDGEVDAARALPLLEAYAAHRPFSHSEYDAWQAVCCIAAQQFWLSRLATRQRQPLELTGRPSKDPAQFRRILLHRINRVPDLPR